MLPVSENWSVPGGTAGGDCGAEEGEVRDAGEWGRDRCGAARGAKAQPVRPGFDRIAGEVQQYPVELPGCCAISPASRGKMRFGPRKGPLNTENQIYINDMDELDRVCRQRNWQRNRAGIGSGGLPALFGHPGPRRRPPPRPGPAISGSAPRSLRRATQLGRSSGRHPRSPGAPAGRRTPDGFAFLMAQRVTIFSMRFS